MRGLEVFSLRVCNKNLYEIDSYSIIDSTCIDLIVLYKSTKFTK
jgi:hypothetical protein